MLRTNSLMAVVCMLMVGVVATGSRALAGVCPSFSIVSSDPADGFVDPLQDFNLAGDTPQGIDHIQVSFSCDAMDAGTGLAPTTANFWLQSTDGTPPNVTAVTPVASSTTDFVVTFDGPIPAGAWTTLYTDVVGPGGVALTEGADSVTIGFLPGDVDGSKVTTASDILYIVDMLNHVVGDLNDLPTCDVDRSGQCVASDILRVIDLFNGVATSRPWINVGIGDRPCNVDADCDDGDVCTHDTCNLGACANDPIDCHLETCDPSCLPDPMIQDDACENAIHLGGAGTFTFDDSAATLDGPGHAACVAPANENNFEDNMDADVWACWTAPCSGTVFVETCDLANIDTKLAIYDGCDCPVSDATLLDCNDDTCALQSRVSAPVEAGQQYLVRIGVFPGTTPGSGAISFSCGLDACHNSTDSCDTVHAGVGCSDNSCCETVCTVDPFCGDAVNGQWDDSCVAEAAGLCGGGGFSVCGVVGSGSCNDYAGTGSAGCEDADCCNTVCALDTYCCLNEWDDVCAQEEAQYCRSACGSGDCFSARSTPGCESDSCCAQVCIRDPFCCGAPDATGLAGAWDDVCAQEAQALCQP